MMFLPRTRLLRAEPFAVPARGESCAALLYGGTTEAEADASDRRDFLSGQKKKKKSSSPAPCTNVPRTGIFLFSPEKAAPGGGPGPSSPVITASEAFAFEDDDDQMLVVDHVAGGHLGHAIMDDDELHQMGLQSASSFEDMRGFDVPKSVTEEQAPERPMVSDEDSKAKVQAPQELLDVRGDADHVVDAPVHIELDAVDALAELERVVKLDNTLRARAPHIAAKVLEVVGRVRESAACTMTLNMSSSSSAAEEEDGAGRSVRQPGEAQERVADRAAGATSSVAGAEQAEPAEDGAGGRAGASIMGASSIVGGFESGPDPEISTKTPKVSTAPEAAEQGRGVSETEGAARSSGQEGHKEEHDEHPREPSSIAAEPAAASDEPVNAAIQVTGKSQIDELQRSHSSLRSSFVAIIEETDQEQPASDQDQLHLSSAGRLSRPESNHSPPPGEGFAAGETGASGSSSLAPASAVEPDARAQTPGGGGSGPIQRKQQERTERTQPKLPPNPKRANATTRVTFGPKHVNPAPASASLVAARSEDEVLRSPPPAARYDGGRSSSPSMSPVEVRRFLQNWHNPAAAMKTRRAVARTTASTTRAGLDRRKEFYVARGFVPEAEEILHRRSRDQEYAETVDEFLSHLDESSGVGGACANAPFEEPARGFDRPRAELEVGSELSRISRLSSDAGEIDSFLEARGVSSAFFMGTPTPSRVAIEEPRDLREEPMPLLMQLSMKPPRSSKADVVGRSLAFSGLKAHQASTSAPTEQPLPVSLRRRTTAKERQEEPDLAIVSGALGWPRLGARGEQTADGDIERLDREVFAVLRPTWGTAKEKTLGEQQHDVLQLQERDESSQHILQEAEREVESYQEVLELARRAYSPLYVQVQCNDGNAMTRPPSTSTAAGKIARVHRFKLEDVEVERAHLPSAAVKERPDSFMKMTPAFDQSEGETEALVAAAAREDVQDHSIENAALRNQLKALALRKAKLRLAENSLLQVLAKCRGGGEGLEPDRRQANAERAGAADSVRVERGDGNVGILQALNPPLAGAATTLPATATEAARTTKLNDPATTTADANKTEGEEFVTPLAPEQIAAATAAAVHRSQRSDHGNSCRGEAGPRSSGSDLQPPLDGAVHTGGTGAVITTAFDSHVAQPASIVVDSPDEHATAQAVLVAEQTTPVPTSFRSVGVVTEEAGRMFLPLSASPGRAVQRFVRAEGQSPPGLSPQGGEDQDRAENGPIAPARSTEQQEEDASLVQYGSPIMIEAASAVQLRTGLAAPQEAETDHHSAPESEASSIPVEFSPDKRPHVQVLRRSGGNWSPQLASRNSSPMA